MTELEQLIDKIDQEYDRTTGFLGLLRQGTFDSQSSERLLDLLSSLELGNGPVDRRLVQLLWYMPIFLQWQIERFDASGRDAAPVRTVMNKVVSRLEVVIGVP